MDLRGEGFRFLKTPRNYSHRLVYDTDNDQLDWRTDSMTSV